MSRSAEVRIVVQLIDGRDDLEDIGFFVVQAGRCIAQGRQSGGHHTDTQLDMDRVTFTATRHGRGA